MKITLPFL